MVYDQLSSDALAKLLPVLDPNGALARSIRRGAYFEQSVFPYVNTLTAPGHAAIFSGAPPAVSGISGNEDIGLDGARVPTVHSPEHEVLGNPGASASPARLRAQTIGQALRAQHPAAKLVAIAGKDRAAVFSMGPVADLALWYDSRIGSFTSSTYYAERLPRWVEAQQRERPIAALLGPWRPEQPELYQRLLGADGQSGESPEWGGSFPH